MRNYAIFLKKERKYHNYTQAQLAKLAGIAQTTISAYERGTIPTIINLEKIADIYNISIDELIGRNVKTNVSVDQRHNNGTINNNF